MRWWITSQKCQKIYQVITLIDCLDGLVETETTLEKTKATVKSFVSDLERVVKDYTSYEMNLVSLLKEDDTIDFSKLQIFENTSKNSILMFAKENVHYRRGLGLLVVGINGKCPQEAI